jgi:hypothetical protein
VAAEEVAVLAARVAQRVRPVLPAVQEQALAAAVQEQALAAVPLVALVRAAALLVASAREPASARAQTAVVLARAVRVPSIQARRCGERRETTRAETI